MKTINKSAFELFAKAYPHEAYAKYPGKFFKFFREYYPLITKKEMIKILKRTSAKTPSGRRGNE